MIGKVEAKNRFFANKTVRFIVLQGCEPVYYVDIQLNNIARDSEPFAKSRKFNLVCERVLDMAAEACRISRLSISLKNVCYDKPEESD